MQENRRDDWPIITLNLDFKSDEPEHHAAVLKVLTEYQAWLCTAPRGTALSDVQPMRVGPVLVLTGEQDAQQQDFYDAVPATGTLLLFGAVHRLPEGGHGPKTNYRRWWNNSWTQIEPEGQPKAGAWTPEDEERLTTAVKAAHAAGLWIRVLHARRLRSRRQVRRLGRELQLRIDGSGPHSLARRDSSGSRFRRGESVRRVRP